MVMASQPEIGKLIRELRLEMGLTQEKFAARLGVTFPTINRWENGRATPSPLAMAKISSVLGERKDCGKHLLGKYFPNEEHRQ